MADSAADDVSVGVDRQEAGLKGRQSPAELSSAYYDCPLTESTTSPVTWSTLTSPAHLESPSGSHAGLSPSLDVAADEPADTEAIAIEPIWIWTCGLDLRVTAVLWANGAADIERFIGADDYKWLAAAEAKQLMDLKRRVIDAAAPMRHQANISWGGAEHTLDLIVTPNLDVHGQVEGITCCCFDLTAQPDPADRSLATGETTEEPVAGDRIDLAAGPDEADRIGGVVLVRSAHALRGPEGEIRLTKTEWLLLDCLLRRRGQLLQREDLLASVWGSGYEDEVSLLHDAVSRLRQRLRAAGVCHDFIRTVHGVGYCLELRGSFITPGS